MSTLIEQPFEIRQQPQGWQYHLNSWSPGRWFGKYSSSEEASSAATRYHQLISNYLEYRGVLSEVTIPDISIREILDPISNQKVWQYTLQIQPEDIMGLDLRRWYGNAQSADEARQQGEVKRNKFLAEKALQKASKIEVDAEHLNDVIRRAREIDPDLWSTVKGL